MTTIYVVAPFNRPVGLNISFTKPNKLVTSPAVMKWVGTLGNVKIPVSFVNIPEQFTDTYNVWAYALPYSITEQNGVVGVSVNAVIADSVDASGNQAYKGNLTTFTGQFTVAYSALPEPPTDIPTEWTQDKVLDLLNNYYNDAIQKIGEMNTLKTTAKDTLVKAINEVLDEIASTNATIGDLSALTTDEKTTIVGAINEVDERANTAQQTADNATELANTGISKAEQAQATANTAVNTANEAKTIAQGNQRAIGFATLKAAITALNGYDNSQLKVGDNVYIVETGVPDLWAAAVEQNSVAYNYTTNDAFNDDLVENTLVQVGYYKFAYLESDGKPCTVAWQNMTVAESDWVASTEFADFAYEAKIALTDFVNFSSIPQVVFGLTEASSGNYAPICKAGDKGVYIYSKVNTAITLPTIITFAPNVHGASMQGGGYTNKGKWVASTTYEINDLVYTDKGQYVCIEGITSTTSPDNDTTHWQASFVSTAGTTKNVLNFVGRNKNDTNVLMAFDGSMEQYVSFNTFTIEKTSDDVLEISAKGTIPEALPQTASALKSGNLPITGWEKTGFQTFWEGTAQCDASTYKPIGTSKELADILYSDDTAYMMVDYNYQYGNYDKKNAKFSYKNSNASVGSMTGISFRSGSQVDNPTIFITRDGTMYGRGSNFASSAYSVTYTRIGTSTISQQFYTISDTSITANSDILMELTDDGGVKSYSMEAGKMTVIRDTVPTSPIPYTYKVKQTNASGQFTLMNHFVPSTPESPTSLPVTYKKVTGELPTSGWTATDKYLYDGDVSFSSSGLTYICDVPDIYLNQETQWKIRAGSPSSQTTYENQTLVRNTDSELYFYFTNVGAGNIVVYIKINKTTKKAYGETSAQSIYLYKIWNGNVGIQSYTIPDTFISANTSVKMYLTDAGGTKARSKANGSITVIRDEVPTTAIPYEYEVEQTSAEGLLEVINAYVPNVPVTSVNGQTGAVTITVPAKTSQLTNDSGFIRPTEANTFTGEQTFSNPNGIKTNCVHNLNGNAWYDFDGTNDRLGSLATPTIVRTSEARPKAEVPSGSATAIKELALLEDVQGAGEWVSVTGETATLTQAGTYQVLFGASYGVQSIIYWDGTNGAEGICSTAATVTSGRPFVTCRYPHITADGVLSMHFVTITADGGTWTETTTTSSGFKYRKIN